MKVTAHLLIAKGYSRAISASQWINEVLVAAEEYNKDYYGEEEFLSNPMVKAAVTITFEVPDEVFERKPITELNAEVVK